MTLTKEALRQIVHKYHMTPVRENILEDSMIIGFYAESSAELRELEELEKNASLSDNFSVTGWYDCGVYRYKIIIDRVKYDLRELCEEGSNA